MNAQIEVLATLATTYIEPTENSGEGWIFDKEKFAKLIIQECARVARATPAPDFHEHLKQQLGHTWDMAAIEAGREIIKHFGIK